MPPRLGTGLKTEFIRGMVGKEGGGFFRNEEYLLDSENLGLFCVPWPHPPGFRCKSCPSNLNLGILPVSPYNSFHFCQGFNTSPPGVPQRELFRESA
jgi:hypothetical protein